MPLRRRAARAPVRRPRRALRRYRKMKKVSSYRPSNSGGTFIVRKVQELISSCPNGLSPGQYTIGTSNNSVILGTPVLAPGTTLNTYDVPFSVKFRLDELTNSTELTNLFDRYKIVSAMVKCNFMNFPGDTRIPLPYIDYIQDYDDANLPTVASMREKMGTKSKTFTASRPRITMGVKPRVAQEIFNNGITTSYAVPRGSTWVNCAYPSVEHYAIKGVIRNLFLPATTGSAPISWDISYGVALKDAQ